MSALREIIRVCAAGALVLAAAFPASSQGGAFEPKQVDVSAKIIEFQTTKGMETGLSAYFRQRERHTWYGTVKQPKQGIMTADVTFPASTTAGVTVFLDGLRLSYGDVELILQGLVTRNRASILSQPRTMVMVGGQETRIQTVDRVPYESTTVVGATTVQGTEFRDTGVMMKVGVPEVFDEDGDWSTNDDTYIKLNVHAEVSEEGQRIIIALDDQVARGGVFSGTESAISAPEFVTRSIMTSVYMRDGQILVLGGLYNSSATKSLKTLPWLKQAEDVSVGLAERVVPGDYLVSPLSSALGNRNTSASRRELVFFIKAQVWRPSYTVVDESILEVDIEEDEEDVSPGDVISDVLSGISELPQNIGEGLKGRPGRGIETDLGGGN